GARCRVVSSRYADRHHHRWAPWHGDRPRSRAPYSCRLAICKVSCGRRKADGLRPTRGLSDRSRQVVVQSFMTAEVSIPQQEGLSVAVPNDSCIIGPCLLETIGTDIR